MVESGHPETSAEGIGEDKPPLIQLAKQPLTCLFEALHKYRRMLNLSLLASALNKLADLAPPILVGWAVDTVIGTIPAPIAFFSGDSLSKAAAVLGVLALIIFALESLFEWLFTIGFMTLAQHVQHDLRTGTYNAMQRREMAFFEGHRVGETMAILGDDINQLERFLSTVFKDIVQLVTLFLIAGSILLYYSPGLSLIAMLPMPIIVIGSLSFQRLLGPKYQALRASFGDLNTRLENNIAGMAVIKSFTAEAFESERLAKASKDFKSTSIAAIRLSAIFTPIIRLCIGVSFGAVLFVGARWTYSGVISPGTFTLFGMMCQRLLWPLTRLGSILDETERGKASAARVFGLLHTPSKIIDEPRATDPGKLSGLIEFQDVKFRYDYGPTILSGLSLRIKAGETIGIAGSTGAGKSTIIKLLLRLHEPTSGSILYDNYSIESMTLTGLRRNIALVSQDVYLFQGTISENLAYGCSAASSAELIKVAEQVRLAAFIESLPLGYDTLVGERGIKLSGGQRQRLSIARAILKDAPILILDEATSSVDTETERAIQEHLSEYTAGRTAIIIAHRLSTIRGADRIVVIEGGELVEEGRHHDLLDQNGTYAGLWRLQAGE